MTIRVCSHFTGLQELSVKRIDGGAGGGALVTGSRYHAAGDGLKSGQHGKLQASCVGRACQRNSSIIACTIVFPVQAYRQAASMAASAKAMHGSVSDYSHVVEVESETTETTPKLGAYYSSYGTTFSRQLPPKSPAAMEQQNLGSCRTPGRLTANAVAGAAGSPAQTTRPHSSCAPTVGSTIGYATGKALRRANGCMCAARRICVHA